MSRQTNGIIIGRVVQHDGAFYIDEGNGPVHLDDCLQFWENEDVCFVFMIERLPGTTRPVTGNAP